MKVNVEDIRGSDDLSIQIRRVLSAFADYTETLEARITALELEEAREKAAATRRKAKTDAPA